MTRAEEKIRVGSTPNLKYTLRDSRGDAVALEATDTLTMRFVAPSGGTSKTVTPALFSGTTDQVHYRCPASTFDAAGEWIVAIRVLRVSGTHDWETTVDKIHVDASRF